MNYIYGMDFDIFFSIVDNMYDEIIIYDKNFNIVYINKACIRHYGCSPEQMIGKSFYDFVHADWWRPSILPTVYREKRAYAIRQTTYMGAELLTIAIPLFDENNEIQFVVMNVRDNVNEVDLYNPHYFMEQPQGSADIPIAKSEEMQAVIRRVERLAQSDAPCILCGESGTGKTVIAQYLYSISNRKDQPLATFNCARMPDDKIQQELFGTDKVPGLLYKMQNGTLLMENISDMSLDAQARLLRYIEDTYAVSSRPAQSPRLLASTDKNLKALIHSGQFLEELYYLLNIAEIYIPPLRKRRSDIRPLIYYFLGYFCPKYNVNRHFTEGAIQALTNAEWHENVRELRYTVERLVVMSDYPVIDTNQLPKRLFGIVDTEEAYPLSESENFDERVANFESALIHDAYQKYGTSRKVAEHLGISQTRANNMIRKYITSAK